MVGKCDCVKFLRMCRLQTIVLVLSLALLLSIIRLKSGHTAVHGHLLPVTAIASSSALGVIEVSEPVGPLHDVTLIAQPTSLTDASTTSAMMIREIGASLEMVRPVAMHVKAGTSITPTRGVHSLESPSSLRGLGGATNDAPEPEAEARSQTNIGAGRAVDNHTEMKRRRCLQRAFEKDLRWPLSRRLMYRKGCNTSVITDFPGWAAKTGCGKAPPTQGKLTLHMAWAGQWNDIFAPDLTATLDSFVVTQNLSRTRLVFWFLEEPPIDSPTYQALVRRVSKVTPPGSIDFRRANLDELAGGTCVGDTPRLWRTAGSIPLQTKSDVFRLLILHKYGGIWIDTDTILLRDVTPVWEWGGEFGGKFAMTLKFNNAFLGIRRNSSLSWKLLDLICRFPKVDGRRTEYCREVGEPCHTEWWYNHGPQQWAVQNRLGLVPFPIGLFDPANDCYGRGMLSGSGAYRLKKGWPLSSVLELFRGAYALHTRSYQVSKKDRPLTNTTYFGALFQELRHLADRRTRVHPIAAGGLRNTVERATFENLAAQNRLYTPPDPTFTPTEIPRLVFLTQAVADIGTVALTVSTLVSNGYAKTFSVIDVKSAVPAATTPFSTAACWLLFSREGYLMPATSNVVQTYCVDADPVRPVKGRPDTIPDLNHCDPRRPRQQWSVRSTGPTTMRLELRARSGQCFGLAPVIDERFCGGSSKRVSRWKESALATSQCINGAVVNCSDPTAEWEVAAVDERLTDAARLLTRQPLPLLQWDTP